MGTVIIVQSQPHLLGVVGTLHASRRFAGCLNSRQQKSDQNTNDRDDDEKFKKGESTYFSPPPILTILLFLLMEKPFITKSEL